MVRLNGSVKDLGTIKRATIRRIEHRQDLVDMSIKNACGSDWVVFYREDICGLCEIVFCLTFVMGNVAKSRSRGRTR